MSFSEDPTQGIERGAAAGEDPAGSEAADVTIDPSQGREVGEQPDEDPTRGGERGEGAYEDPTQGGEPGEGAYEDPTQGAEVGSSPGEDPLSPSI